MQSTLQESADASTWNQLAPLLDEAMSRLGQKDRDAVILRFFKEKSVRDVAATLQVNEAAAQRRILRALVKLRNFFTKRGVSSTTAIIAGAISANSVQAAPVALAKAVTAVAIVKGAAASGSTLTLIQGALKIMAWIKVKTAIAVCTAVVLATGTTVVVKEMVSDSVKVLARFDWQKLKDEHRLLGGEVMQLDGETVLKLESANGAGLSSPLLKIAKPPITVMNYAVTGEMEYDIEGVGHLEMWSFFSALKPGLQAPQYYSFTGEETGPMGKIHGTSDWRVFSLPLDRTGKTYPESFSPRMDPADTVHPPMRLEINVV